MPRNEPKIVGFQDEHKGIPGRRMLVRPRQGGSLCHKQFFTNFRTSCSWLPRSLCRRTRLIVCTGLYNRVFKYIDKLQKLEKKFYRYERKCQILVKELYLTCKVAKQSTVARYLIQSTKQAKFSIRKVKMATLGKKINKENFEKLYVNIKK